MTVSTGTRHGGGQFRPEWKVVITLIPDPTAHLKTLPELGLASRDENQRCAACRTQSSQRWSGRLILSSRHMRDEAYCRAD